MMSNVRTAFRSLLRRPSLSLTVVLSLALGIGMLMAVLNVVDAVLLRPLAYPDAERIFEIRMSRIGEPGDAGEGRISYPDYRDWSEQARIFSHVAAVSEESFVLAGAGGAERIPGARVTAGFFGALGLEPELGAVNLADWRAPGARIAVLGHDFWRRRFAGDPGALGRPLRLDDKVFTVVGVMPRGLDLPREAAVWLPLDAGDPDTGAEVRGARYLLGLGRLRTGTGEDVAAEALRRLSRRLARTHPENQGYVATLTPLRDALVGDLRRGLLFLALAAGLVLLIVCINVAGILAASGISRSGDLWVRLALGASRGHLARLLVTENLILALAGGALGLLVAVVSGRLLVDMHPEDFGFVATLGARGAWLAAGLLIALGAGLIVSLPVVLQTARRELGLSGGRGAVGPSRVARRAQAVLLVLQLGVALALLNAAGLMLHSLAKLLTVDPGFRAEGLVTARVSLPTYRYTQPYQQAAFFRQLLERIRRQPGVEAAAAVTSLPFSGSDMLFGFTPLGGAVRQASSGQGEVPRAHYRAVSPEYFRVLGVPLLDGRFLEPGDEAGAPPVAVVNQAFARRFLPDRAALGQRLRLMYGNGDPVRVVGVVGDVRHSGLAAEPQPEIYIPYTQQPWAFMALVVRNRGDFRHAAASLRIAVAGLDPDQPVDRIEAMTDLVAGSVSRPRFYSLLLGAFALLALATAVVGAYGLTSHWVSLRLREAGLHMAFGASRRAVQGLFLRKPLVLALAGLVLGGALASLLSLVLSGLLYGISPDDPANLLTVAAILLLAVILAAWLPARRASRIDPAVILRHESLANPEPTRLFRQGG